MNKHLLCCIHITDDASELKSFSAVSWDKVKLCASLWHKTNGPEWTVAEKLSHILVDIDPPADIGYHRTCYMRFTDKNRISKSIKRTEKQSGEFSKTAQSSSISEEVPRKHFLRCLDTGMIGPSTSSNLMPRKCLICRTNKFVLDKTTHKRKIENLVQCQTDINLLKQAAIKKNDEFILVHIRDRDMSCIEVCYHSSCYKQYTRNVSKKGSQKVEEKKYTESFKVFCTEIIEKRIIQGKEILRINKLKDMYLKCIKEYDHIVLSKYENRKLKRELQNTYSQLRFVKQSKRNKCELVFCETVNEDSCQIMRTDFTSTESSETDSADVNETTDVNDTPKPSEDISYKLQVLFSAASILKSVISNSEKNSSWPPKPCDLSLENAERMIPIELYNFLAWIMGISDEPAIHSHVPSTEDSKRKILSIAQDIVYMASNGKKQTPKHLTLGMTLRHLTGSAQIAGILNGLGHCVSHSTVLRYETDLALQQINSESLIPQGFEKDVFTTLVFDNNDFGEETLSGAGTTHNTNGIILQWKHTEMTLPYTDILQSLNQKKGRRKTVNPPETAILVYKCKKTGPEILAQKKPLPTIELEKQKIFKHIDDCFYLSKFPDAGNDNLPGWTGFNTQLFKVTGKTTKIGYLPVLDACPTDISTINTMLHRSLEIAKELRLDNIVVVSDQAIYSKAQKIRWDNKEFQEKIVLRLGDFHLLMSFLAIIGKRFQDSGLEDIFIESGLVAENSVEGVMSGKHYNRCVRTHKLVAEALEYLRWKSFCHQLKSEEIENIILVSKKLGTSFKKGEFLNDIDICNEVIDKYKSFIQEKCEENPTFKFWCSYLQMIELMLLFTRATRDGDWRLHLECLTSMMPWYFSYDRVNYARYLPVYWMDMVRLAETHPAINEEFLNGNFVVQRQQEIGFSKIACDQVIEQTINRDSKTKGGLAGITLNKGAVHRWVLTHHSRASILNQCEIMAGKGSTVRHKKELESSRVCIDNTSVENVMETITSLIDPFSEHNDDLINIASGAILPNSIQSDVEEAYSYGKASMDTFTDERLVQGKLDWFKPIKCLKLKTFSVNSKVSKTTVKDEIHALKASRQLLTRLILIAKVRNIDMQYLMEFNLSPVPTAIANYDGTMVKTNKAALIHALERNPETQTALSAIPENSALLIDGMALLQQMKQIPLTFGELSEKVFSYSVKLAMELKCSRVDFVTDRYPAISIKHEERSKRSTSLLQLVKIISDNQQVPKQWKKFLALGANKESLINYLYLSWKKCKSNSLKNITLYLSHGEKCHSFTSYGENEVAVNSIEDLTCDHEEADTRLFLHAAHASNTHSTIVIKCSDTDVHVIAVALQKQISANIYIWRGNSTSSSFLDISKVLEELGENVCEALIGLHSFTGCDSVSAFKGKGKKSALKLIQANEAFSNYFQLLGSSWTVDDGLVAGLEAFVCHLYGQTQCTNVNICRYNWLRLGCNSDISLPPNKDSLGKHILRANFQAAIHRRSLLQRINAPSPNVHGWKIENNNVSLNWMSQQPLPDILFEHVHCKCKKSKCITKQCSCQNSKVQCTELCACIQCDNQEKDADE